MEVDYSKENAPKVFTPFSIENILKAEDKMERHEPANPSKLIDLGEQLGIPLLFTSYMCLTFTKGRVN